MLDTLIAEFASPFTAVPWSVVIVRMLAAVALGGAIGWEREINSRAAGLRTHILIALAACLFTLLAFDLMQLDTEAEGNLKTDPLRLIEAVTAGVAFLAAGSIITSGGAVHGLTTGASMWMCGAIGLACGLGRISLALLTTVIVVIVLWLLRQVVEKAKLRDSANDPAGRVE